MDSFLDTNVIVNYTNFTEQTNNKLIRKCFEYIHNKKGKFIISFYVKKELDILIERRAIISKIVIDSINKNYFSSSKQLSENDILYAKKLYESLKEKTNYEQIILEELDNFRSVIILFQTKIVDEINLYENEINISLVKIINEFIKDYSDCLVLVSAIQIQQEKEQFLFVTGDKHFSEGSYDFIKEDPRTEKYKKPILKNLFYE